MENHYHLLISVGEKGLAGGMCELNSGYACAFNARHGRMNHLFGKRYWSRRIKTDASLWNVVRYIVQNPRRAGVAQTLDGYRWTSYAATIGLALADIKLARDEVLRFFSRSESRAVETFRWFCSASPMIGTCPVAATVTCGARPSHVTVYSGPLPPSGGVRRPPLAVIAPHWTQFDGASFTVTVPSPSASPTS